MTEYNYSNTHKATIQGDNGVQVTVIRNLSTAQDFSSGALWLKREVDGQKGSPSTGYYDTYGIEAARALYKNIGIVLAELDDITESAKPKAASDEELRAAKPGTRVYALGLSPFDKDAIWLRTSHDEWIIIEDGDRKHRIGDIYTTGVLAGLVTFENAEEVN